MVPEGENVLRWLARKLYWLPDQLDGWIHGPKYRAMVLVMEEQNQHEELDKKHGREDDGDDPQRKRQVDSI